MEELLIGNAGSALLKSATHKYVKRTGSSGNYKYWYKGPGGKLVAGKDWAIKPTAVYTKAELKLAGK